MKHILLPVYLIALILLSSCSRDHHDHPDLTNGKQLFNHHCAECHGAAGTGKIVDVTPANILTRKNRSEIADFIISGTDHDRNMPVFKNMSYDEADKIAIHLLELKRTYNKSKERKFKELMIAP